MLFVIVVKYLWLSLRKSKWKSAYYVLVSSDKYYGDGHCQLSMAALIYTNGAIEN